MSRRGYDNSRRAEQARRTRRRVLDTARDLIVERGPAAVTMRDVATHADVSVETVYKTFRTKAALIKDVYDVTLAGDDEPIPMIDRPELRAVFTAADPRDAVARYAALARLIADRVGPLLARLLAGARGGDPELARFRETINQERLAGAGALVHHLAATGGLRPGTDPARACDLVWTLISPEVHELLVTDRGWPPDEYEQWLATALTDALTAGGVPPSGDQSGWTRFAGDDCVGT